MIAFSEGRGQPDGSSNSSKFDDFCSTFKHYFNVLTLKRPDVDASAMEGALANNDQRDLDAKRSSPSKESGVQPSVNVEMEALLNQKLDTESVSTGVTEMGSYVVTEETIQNNDVFKD